MKLAALILLASVVAAIAIPRGSFMLSRMAEQSRRGAGELWTPADLGTALEVWLDASDTSTLFVEFVDPTTNPDDGDRVRQWHDKSGNNYHFSSDTFSPFFNEADQGVDYSLDNDRRSFGPNNPVAQTAEKSAYVVNKRGNASPSSSTPILNLYSSGTTGAQGAIQSEIGYRAGARSWISSTPTDANTRALVALTQTEGGNLHASTKMYLNATEVSRTSGTDGARVDVAAQMLMGYVSSFGRHDGTINEFILTNKEDSLDTRQKIEGYLAHKWGLTANLPSGHPYKNKPPYKPAYVYPSGLAAYWSMDSRSGTTVFDTKGDNDGTAVGTPLFGTDYGKHKEGVDLNGSSQYINVSRNPPLLEGSFTASAWVKHDNITADHVIIDKAAEFGGLPGLVLFRDDVGIVSGRTDIYQIFIGDAAAAARIESASGSSVTGSWTHVVCTFVPDSASGLRLYINGNEDANSPVNTTGLFNNANTSGIRVGASSSLNRYLDGQMDEIAIFNRALSSNEVSEIYNDGVGRFYTP